jgi:hypothetical protein
LPGHIPRENLDVVPWPLPIFSLVDYSNHISFVLDQALGS